MEDHNELCQDILYLINKNDGFALPFTFSFRKDGSPYTAATVAYAADFLKEEELNYWLTYMNEDIKSLFYLKIIVESEDYVQWVKNTDFRSELLRDWGFIDHA